MLPDEDSAPPGAGAVKYAAFISYSRAVDGRLAPAVQDALHRFAKPWYRPRALRVFRDDASLSANSALWLSIERALLASEFFILLASRRAAESKWVQREVGFWLANKPKENLLVVLTAGPSPSTPEFWQDEASPLPPVLREALRTEADKPRYVDLRWAHTEEHLSLTDGRFSACVADLAATLHHRDKDAMTGEDVRQHRRTRRLVRAVVAVLTTLAVLACGAAVIAVGQRRAAVDQRQTAIRQRDLATARSLVVQAEQLRGRDIRQALKINLAAVQLNPSVETRRSLAATLSGTQLTTTVTEADYVGDIDFSPDGRTLSVATNAMNGRGGRVQLWDVSDRRAPTRMATATVTESESEYVGEVAFSRDGHTLVVAMRGRGGGRVQLWDVSDRRAPTRMATATVTDSESEYVGEVAFSRDGHTLAVTTYAVGDSSGGGTVQLWDLSSATPTRVAVVADPQAVVAVAFGPDGRTLAVTTSPRDGAGRGGTVQLWDISDHLTPTRIVVVPESQDVGDVAFSPDGRIIATTTSPAGITSSGGETVQLWDVSNRRKPARAAIAAVAEPVDMGDVAFSPDGHQLAVTTTNNAEGSSSDGGAIQLWDVSNPHNLNRTATLPDPHKVGAVAFSPDGRAMATTTYFGGSTTVSNQEEFSSSDGGTIRLWDVLDPHAPVQTATVTDPQNVGDAAFSPDGHTLATTTDPGVDTGGGTFQLWDVSNPHDPIRVATVADAQNVGDVAFSPDGHTLAVTTQTLTGNGGTLQLWDVSNPHDPSRTATVADPQSVGALAFSPDGHSLAVTTSYTLFGGDSGGTVQLWNVSSRDDPTRIATVSDPHNVGAIAFSPDGHSLAVGTTSDGAGTVQLWNVSALQASTPAATVTDLQAVSALAFSPDGHTLAITTTADGGGTIQLWDISGDRPASRADISTDPERPGAVAFSPDGHTLAVISGPDGGGDSIKLWDVSDLGAPTPVATTATEPRPVSTVAFSSDGRTLAVTTALGAHRTGGTVQLWDVNWAASLSGHLHSWACRATDNDLSAKEWEALAPGIAHHPDC